MNLNGRHHAPTGRIRRRRIGLGTRWPDGFRPLSLAPLRPAEPDQPAEPGRSGRPGADEPPAPDATAGPSGAPRGAAAPDPVPGATPPDPRSAHPASGSPRLGREEPAGADGSATGAADAEFTPERAAARAREITDWLTERQRRLESRDDPPGRWRAVEPPSPPDPRPGRFRRPDDREPSAALREAIRRMHADFHDSLRERWGGSEALEALDAEPLPAEAFDWSSVPAAHRARVEQILALVDDTCRAWFDHEHRTACRRLLARVAGEPWIIARRGKVETIAGAIVWTIASFNGTTGRRRQGGRVVPATWIAGHLGLSSASAFPTRSIDICVAAGIHLHRGGPHPVGEPGLIVSQRRRHAIWLREKYRDPPD